MSKTKRTKIVSLADARAHRRRAADKTDANFMAELAALAGMPWPATLADLLRYALNVPGNPRGDFAREILMGAGWRFEWRGYLGDGWRMWKDGEPEMPAAPAA